MVLFSIRKIQISVMEKSISGKCYLVYAFISISSILTIINTTRYPVNVLAYNIIPFLGIIVIGINILKFVLCYNIIKEKSVAKFAYSIIPIQAVLTIRYGLLILTPLIIISVSIIKLFNLDFSYWNVVNSQFISIIYSIIHTYMFIKIIKKIMASENINIE